jgi:hypothetical protein
MITRDLQRFVQEYESANDSAAMQNLLNRSRGRPFYIWGLAKHKSTTGYSSNSNCCFNHIIGLPQKNGIAQPLWDYQNQIYKALMIPNYINSRPTPEYPLSHNIVERKAKEREKDKQYFSWVQTKTCVD